MINIILILVLFINGVISVANASSEKLLERLPVEYKKLGFKEVGKAKLSVLFWDIYNSSLYTKSGNYHHESSPASILFKIEYLKDITTEDLLERTVEQWKHLNISESQYTPYISRLKAIWPNISSGDSLTMLVEDKKSIFYLNNVKVGVIADKAFSKIFLDIWLSPKTSQVKLRAQLLKGNKL